jgi:uncharacterized protein YbbK (DUF523 family)
MKAKILVSACFLGENVRYDGGHQKLTHCIISQWKAENRLVGGCPECLGGLSVPRAPAEIQKHQKSVITVTGVDVTSEFTMGAEKTLEICKKENVRYAVLKESSPSCGSHYIYDGSFSNNKIMGKGITAQLLHENGISVYSENNIEALYQLIG